MEVNLINGFKHPTSILIAGNSGSGKSCLVANIIRKGAIHPEPEKIFWFYRQYQTLYNELLQEGHPIEFHEGLPENISEARYFDKRSRNLCIIDDLHLEKGSSEHVAQLFCNAGRHSNTTVIYITQNLFFKQSHGRDIRLNAKVIICFKNPQDRLQLSSIGRQVYPGKLQFFMSAVDKCFDRQFGYVVLDLSQATQDKYRVRSSLFGESEQGYPEVYVPTS